MRYRFLRFPEGKAKAVTLSYDDGTLEDIRLSDTISKYGLKCTFNLNGGALLGENGLSVEQIKEYILDRGHEVAIHGEKHCAPGSTRAVEGIRDALNCRIELEKKLGIIIRGMAYPDSGITYFDNGSSYETIKNYLKDLDVVYARSILGDNTDFFLPQDWYNWIPSVHNSNPEIMNIIDKFLSVDMSPEVCQQRRINRSRRGAKLFYMWGHSYEFERTLGWELLEDICRKLAGKDDIWYATNMEIYEYVNAYNSLVFSADSTIVHNPTTKDIWFDVDGVLYKISSEETLTI